MFSYNNSSLHSNNYYEPEPFPHDQSFLSYSATPNSSPNPNPNPNSNISNSRHHQPQDIHTPSSSLFNLAASLFEDDGDLLFQPHHHGDAAPKTLLEDPHHHPHHHQGSTTSTAPSTKMVDWDSNKNSGGSQLQQQQQIQVATVVRRRSCKKDRHSKIRTARGMRDRRMRLSLDVAQKFFSLQDVLGFDKASKTVQWLLTQAASEIDKLTSTTSTATAAAAPGGTAAGSASSISECEVVSGGTDHETAATGDVIDDERIRIRKKPSDRIKKKKTTTTVVVRRAFQKASRESARARARERTQEKMRRRHQYCDNNTVDQTWSTFETTREESGGTQSSNNMKDYQQHQPTTISNFVFQAPGGAISSNINYTNNQDQLLQVAIDHDDSSMMGKCSWCPSSIWINSLQSTTTGSTSLEQPQLSADFQFFGKLPWEVDNNGSTHSLLF